MNKIRKYYLLYVLIVFFIVGIGTAYSEEADTKENQEVLYLKALSLKEDWNYDDALIILKKLVDEYPENSVYELGYLDTLLDQLVQEKAAGNKSWNKNLRELQVKIKAIHGKNSSNADYYLVWAKYSWLVETKRESNIFKALEKAIYMKPNYSEAYILKGDIYFDRAKNTGVEDAARRINAEEAKASYASALSIINISDKRKAYVFYRTGELETQLFGNKDAAKTNWAKAAILAPDSKISKLVQERLK